MSIESPATATMEEHLAVVRQSRRSLERTMRHNPAPPMDDLVGWEYDGINTSLSSVLIGARKFRKGFYRGPSRAKSGPEPFIQGYNINVWQDGIHRTHHARPSDELPKRFGFYRVYPAHLNVRHRIYPQSLLLDYWLGGNGLAPPALLRDYLVQVNPGRSDLLLGHAFGTVRLLTIPVSFFVLRRVRRHDFTG